MNFTPRLRQILLVMLNEELISVKSLSEQVGISKRTIQRELEYIDHYLKKYNVRIRSKAGRGIWLEGTEEHRDHLYRELKDQNLMDSTNREERRKRLAVELIKDQEPKKLYYFSNAFKVSETTISRDLEKIESWFAPYHLRIEKKPGIGVVLQGSEKNYRTAAHDFIINNVDSSVIKYIFEEDEKFNASAIENYEEIKNIFKILDDSVLKRVCLCFSSFRDIQVNRLTQESYYELIIHVTIIVERVIKGEIIENNEKLMNEIRKDKNLKAALEIVNALEEEFEIEIPDNELAYICLHLNCTKLQSVEMTDCDFGEEEQQKLLELVHEIIVAYDEVLSNTLKTDEEFVRGLLVHLKPTLVRMRNSFPIINPHLEEIKEIYPDIYKRCKYVGKFLEARTGYKFPEAEIGFLAAHFGAAIVRQERAKEKKRKVRIGLVCASGIGISRLMSSRLEKYFHSRICMNTYGKDDLTPFVKSNNDFFVSSTSLEDDEKEVVYVNPLLPENELRIIETKVSKFELLAGTLESDNDFNRQLEKINYLSAKIRFVLKEYRCIEVDKEMGFRPLIHYLTGQIADNQVFAEIIEHDILKREEIATQVIPQFEIGLFHARTKGVNSPCIYTCVSKEKTAFVHPYLQNMRAVIMMLVPYDENAEDNSRMLSSISEALFQDEEFLEAVKTEEQEVVRSYLSDILKEYFQCYLNEL